jgi:hypothetical protein
VTVMPDQPKPGSQPDQTPDEGDVEYIDEREKTPPHEIVEPEFDDGGDGGEPKKSRRKK